MDVLDPQLDGLPLSSLAVLRILMRKKQASIASLAKILGKDERTVRRALRDLAGARLVEAQVDSQDVRRVFWRTAC